MLGNHEVLWIPLALLGFIRKNLNSNAYANFCRLDEQLGKASDVIKDFYTTNNVHLPLSTQTYIAAYGEYLQSVKAAAELRVTFEREILDYNIWTCTHNDLDNLNSLMDRISHSLDICEKYAQKVNEVIVSFEEQEERE